MATDKIIYIANTQFAPEIDAGDVIRNILEIDWGRPPKDLFSRRRPLLNGSIRRGAVFPSRMVNLTIGSRVDTAAIAAASVERKRDQELDDLNDLLHPDQGLIELKQTRLDGDGDPVARIIDGDLMSQSAWEWQPDDIAPGFVGTHEQPHLVMPLEFECLFPWFRDEDTTDSLGNTLDTTQRTVSITNPGMTRCGLKIALRGTGAGVTVQVVNTTGDKTLRGAGVEFTNITLAAGDDHIVDFYVDDPLVWDAYRESDSTDKIFDEVNGVGSDGPFIMLERGANTIQWQATAGSPSSATIDFLFRAWWGNP